MVVISIALNHMEIKLQSVGTTGVGFIFPEEILVQLNLKKGDVCAFTSAEDGIKLMIYDLESGEMEVAYEQGKIEYISIIRQLGMGGIGTSLPQGILQQFDLNIKDVVPLVKIENYLQLMVSPKPKLPRKLILKSKTPEEKRAEELSDKLWRRERNKPMGWWLGDDAD